MRVDGRQRGRQRATRLRVARACHRARRYGGMRLGCRHCSDRRMTRKEQGGAHRPVIGADVAAGADGGLTAGYDLGAFFDEMFERPGQPRPHYAPARRAPRGDERRPARRSGSGSPTRSSSRRASASRSTATTQAPTASSRSTSSRGSCRQTSGRMIERGLAATAARAQPLPRRHLPPPADPRGRRSCRPSSCSARGTSGAR